MIESDIVVKISDLSLQLGNAWIHKNLNLTIRRGEVLGIVGKSGSGKSVLLRQILALQPPTTGSIKVFGTEITTAGPDTLAKVQHRWGILFQQGALFSSLTSLENVAFPLQEHSKLAQTTIEGLALLKLLMVGLTADVAIKYPNQLSGGMQKRVALARACASDPELLLLDEPSTGLDPDSAAALDDLILNLQATLGLTIVVVTHDLDSLWRVTNRVAFLGEGRVLETAPMAELVNSKRAEIHEFFTGPRGRVTTQLYQHDEKK